MLDFNSKLNPLNVITNGKQTKKMVLCRGEDQVVVWSRIELPVITQQPENVTVDTDETFTLTCKAEANHGTLTYNWYSTDSDQPAHTGSTYTTQYNAAGTHQFYCIVSNERGETTSNTATVTVISNSHNVYIDHFSGFGYYERLYGFAWNSTVGHTGSSHGSITPPSTSDGKPIGSFYVGKSGIVIYIHGGGNNYSIYYQDQKLALNYTDVWHDAFNTNEYGYYLFGSKNNNKNKALYNAIFGHDGHTISGIKIVRK